MYGPLSLARQKNVSRTAKPRPFSPGSPFGRGTDVRKAALSPWPPGVSGATSLRLHPEVEGRLRVLLAAEPIR